MSSSPRIDTSPRPRLDDSLRTLILQNPDLVLEDPEIMRALVAGNDLRMGPNIVDMRAIAMERLETELGRLEDTNRSVIAAAYDNLAGTNQVHRAVLRMLDPVAFEPFLQGLAGEVADILRVDCLRLVLEAEDPEADPALHRLGDVLILAEPGFIETYLAAGRASPRERDVTLRKIAGDAPQIYGARAGEIGSEACLRLDFGDGRLPGLLVLGAADPAQFHPQQGTDLLAFFAGVFERAVRRWLS